ncbi:beta-ketoacyl-[acyl-carrier-protein] synthase family protein [Nocardioides daeguensis]|uniref:3-oxoacyl-[acyl-carrier-protein] synthase 2 n=1 Tax=Nocardioides daeguensis TaxID=908359 RepID=A0ABP6WKS2_9ACTN|nr:beta-ketoacyl-[acyl-carrier-protein] synthase II [Nocardioides daeguensis]MBV6729028.1 beta-ketoacyl-[acyl-carrier-protein] synthase II [Nocardioides daeguensis]MCR1774968.1 beta-ketoacyl-[acyl-carrier-protein] synthase II [Nocardioides daeguensis]
MSRTRVVVTGLGTTSPLGGDVASTWEGLLAGRSGVRPLGDMAEGLPVKIGGTAAVEPTDVLDRVVARRLDRSSQFALVAALEAWADSGLDAVKEAGNLDGDRFGVAFASGIGGVQTLLSNHEILLEKGPRRVSPIAVPMLMANAPAATISLKLGARGPVNTPVSACASGNEAVSLAADQIRLGRVDVAIAGGTEAAIHPLPIAAFANMMALSKNDGDPTTVSRPFDVSRDGFVLGEGAGALVLESLEHAQARGARIYAEVLGTGITADAHDIAQPDPEGRGGTRALRAAVQDAGVAASDIVHVNAHATSTPQGDVAESLMLHAVLGSAANDLVVSATKSMTGHLLGGAGALEAVATVLAIHHRTAPPTINLDEQDARVELDVATKPRDLPLGDIAAINNSFGFGGANVAVVFGSLG